jgi:D-sedoheptulose 7-phosphate isomerase
MSDTDKNAEWLRPAIEESCTTVSSLLDQLDNITAVCSLVVDALRAGNKVLTAGNGGSAAQATHMSEEFIGRFRGNRISLPAVSLAADPAALTCIGNDFGFDSIFSRQVEGLAKPGDVLVLFSSSGNANNLRLALDTAKEKGAKVVCLLGRDGGPMAGLADREIIVRGQATERIQEAHLVLLHVILDAVERAFPAE